MNLEGVFFNTSDFELLDAKIGEGLFGTVYLAKNIKDSQEYAAEINFHSLSDPKKHEPTIITEYLPKGSLKNNLYKGEKCLSNPKLAATKKCIILLGISDTMRYLHGNNIRPKSIQHIA